MAKNRQELDKGKEEQLDSLLADYLRRLDAGELVDRERFLRDHPELAEALAALLDTADLVDRMAGPTVEMKAPSADETSRVDTPTATFDGGAVQPMVRGDGALEPCRFGDYELLEVIGRGGMGVVYRARQINMDRDVAVKMIMTGRLASETDVQRFYSEARAAGKIDHPNIITIYEVNQLEGHHFYSMDYVEGSDLSKIVKAGALEPKRAARYLRDAASAIHAAHQRGILHRDLKPGNVLIDVDDRVLVTDFGLAKIMNQEGGITTTGAAMGTPSYMSPEQAAGDVEKLGPATDVYSLGAILYVLLAGQPPFRSRSIAKTMFSVIHETPRSPLAINPRADRQLVAICMKCLAKNPQHRYQTARELADDLQRFMDNQPVRAKPAGTLQQAWLWMSEIPVVAALAGRRVVAPTPAHVRAQNAMLGAMFLLIVFGLASYFYLDWQKRALPRHIYFATGLEQGMYDKVGSTLAKELEKRLKGNRQVEAVQSDGSGENGERLLSRTAQLGVMQEATIESNDLVRVAPLYYEFVFVVVRHAGNIHEFADLEGKSVSLGPMKSGMRKSAIMVLQHGDVEVATLTNTERPFTDLEKDPSLEAAIITTGLANSSLRKLLGTGDYHLLPIPDVRPSAMHQFHRKPVPYGELGLEQALQGPEQTWATLAFLVSHREAPDALIVAVLDSLYGGKPPFNGLMPQRQAADISGQYHPVAQAYFKKLRYSSR